MEAAFRRKFASVIDLTLDVLTDGREAHVNGGFHYYVHRT